MRLSEFDKIMRQYESDDTKIPSEGFTVARLDGRNFTRLTTACAHPFDKGFAQCVVDVLGHMMKASGFRIIYGYAYSDELSLLFHQNDRTFDRRLSKWLSVLAAEASTKMTCALTVGTWSEPHAAFDCRIIQLPDAERVIDYFRWRQGSCLINALNARCYWTLIDQGYSPKAVTRNLSNIDDFLMRQILSDAGIEFNELSLWERHGAAYYWTVQEHTGTNPVTSEETTTTRNVLTLDRMLPAGEEYGDYLSSVIQV